MLSRVSTISGAAVTVAPPLSRLLQLTVSRLHGAAAQPQLDPDYCNCYGSSEEPHRDQLVRSTPMTDTDGGLPLRGVQWAFIGSPRSKKHVYAEMLSKLLKVPHISMASLVRQELSPHSTVYKQIANGVNQGELVQEDTIFGLLSKRLEDGHCRGETGFILDGIPRTRIQAEILDQLAEIDLVVNFSCTQDFMMNTQGAKPGLIHFNVIPEASWKKRLEDYTKQSKPLEDYYKKQQKLLDFEVGSAHLETWRGLLTALHLEYVHAANSQKLIRGSILP
ncbi:Adenylate kinase [Corchorus olitorius]|uniref:adenylate kinase n=1 Tax=Corchorus olitorius TaxID=93759 RepID=A0A1R3HN92_9ROSI|nr:Adenylate kinase [Corchorus olitorius]